VRQGCGHWSSGWYVGATALAGLCALVLAVPHAHASAGASSGPVAIGPAPAGRALTVTLHFAPRHAGLLGRIAGRRHGAGLSAETLRSLFGPARATTAAADRYLARRGFTLHSSGILTRTYGGSAGAAARAFATPIVLYREAGAVYRRPAGTPSLPPRLASAVTSIDGLSSLPVAHPLIGRSAAVSALTSCAGATTLQSQKGGYQPSQLASSGGYDFQSLLDGGSAGQSDTLAFVEFSNYTPSNVAKYQGCYGTSVPITDVNLNGGTTDRSGAAEVQLDEEVAATAAPRLSHIYTYIAPNDGSVSFGSVIDSIIEDQPSTHTNLVSISWGDCETPSQFSSMRSDDVEFQLAQAAGITVVAASGDTGSDDCGPGSLTYRVDYPSSSPYVTGVGGTSLHLGVSGASHETTWGHPDSDKGTGGGGGASILYTMPGWQSAPGVISADTHTTCGAGGDQPCREVPDVSLDANPYTGYIIYSGGSWRLFGGTSAGAPLLSAMIADADSYSLTNGGRRLGGSANAFFYANAGAPLFRDITMGSNNIYGQTTLYAATAGYDMASGLGTPDGATLASLLLSSTQGTGPDQTSLTASESAAVITPSAGATLHGTLTDQTTNQPLAGRTVRIVDTYSFMGQLQHGDLTAVTNAQGQWSVPVTTDDAPSRTVWRAVYGGDPGISAAGSPQLVLSVQPALTLSASATKTGSSYSVAHGVTFTLRGQSTPNLSGARVIVQILPSGSSTWTSTGTSVAVAADGSYSTPFSFASAGKFSLRFTYAGSSNGPWRTAHSPKALFVVS
jgi:subtilase family serine protease